jgi:hypothetical protein
VNGNNRTATVTKEDPEMQTQHNSVGGWTESFFLLEKKTMGKIKATMDKVSCFSLCQSFFSI